MVDEKAEGAKVNRSPNQPTTKEFIMENVQVVGLCWIWGKACDSRGYGRVWHNGKVRLAHRVCFELWRGEVPHGMCVCHRCDNPRCVKPDHLFLGTDYENKMDCVRKGRNKWPEFKGIDHANAKLTAEQVRAIRCSVIGARKLAPEFGVSVTTIKYVKNRKRYASVD